MPKLAQSEMAASKALLKNARIFHYPQPGFVHKVEYTLLYNMMLYPKIYPKSVVMQEIEEECYADLLTVCNTCGELTSYAQLNALLTLAIKNWSREYTYPVVKGNTIDKTIPQLLYHKLIQTIIVHAKANDLDREHEINVFFKPMQRNNSKQVRRQFAAVLVPYYVGLGLSIVTLNPVPGLIGYAATLAAVIPAEGMVDQHEQVCRMKKAMDRVAKLENSPLLAEADG